MGIEQQTADNKYEEKKHPGFELIYGITGLLSVFLYKKRKIECIVIKDKSVD